MIVVPSEPPAEKVNDVLAPAPKMDPLGCGACWDAAGVWEEPKLNMGVAEGAGAGAGGLANKPPGFVSVAPEVLPNTGFEPWAAGAAAVPKMPLASVAGAAGVLPKMLLVAGPDAGVLVAAKMFAIPAGFAGSGAAVDVAEPNREPDLFSPLPKANFFAAGSSVLAAAGAAPKMLLAGFAEAAENKEGAGFSA